MPTEDKGFWGELGQGFKEGIVPWSESTQFPSSPGGFTGRLVGRGFGEAPYWLGGGLGVGAVLKAKKILKATEILKGLGGGALASVAHPENTLYNLAGGGLGGLVTHAIPGEGIKAALKRTGGQAVAGAGIPLLMGQSVPESLVQGGAQGLFQLGLEGLTKGRAHVPWDLGAGTPPAPTLNDRLIVGQDVAPAPKVRKGKRAQPTTEASGPVFEMPGVLAGPLRRAPIQDRINEVAKMQHALDLRGLVNLRADDIPPRTTTQQTGAGIETTIRQRGGNDFAIYPEGLENRRFTKTGKALPEADIYYQGERAPSPFTRTRGGDKGLQGGVVFRGADFDPGNVPLIRMVGKRLPPEAEGGLGAIPPGPKPTPGEPGAPMTPLDRDMPPVEPVSPDVGAPTTPRESGTDVFKQMLERQSQHFRRGKQAIDSGDFITAEKSADALDAIADELGNDKRFANTKRLIASNANYLRKQIEFRRNVQAGHGETRDSLESAFEKSPDADKIPASQSPPVGADSRNCPLSFEQSCQTTNNSRLFRVFGT